MSGFEYYFRNMLAGLFMSFYLIINFEKYHISQKIAWFITLFSGRRNILDNFIYSHFGCYPDMLIFMFVCGLYSFKYIMQNKQFYNYMFEDNEELTSESTSMSSNDESDRDNVDATETSETGETKDDEANDDADDEAETTETGETKDEADEADETTETGETKADESDETKYDETKEEPIIQRQISLSESVKCDEEFENIPSEE